MYLNKKLICCPIINHFEQESNAYAASKMGVLVLNKIDQNFADILKNWYQHQKPVKLDLKHSTKDIVDILYGSTNFW